MPCIGPYTAIIICPGIIEGGNEKILTQTLPLIIRQHVKTFHFGNFLVLIDFMDCNRTNQFPTIKQAPEASVYHINILYMGQIIMPFLRFILPTKKIKALLKKAFYLLPHLCGIYLHLRAETIRFIFTANVMITHMN